MGLSEDFMEKIFNPFVEDRLSHAYEQDVEYQKLLEENDIVFQKLLQELQKEQAEKLEQYFAAANAAAARKEVLTYMQGMKDLFALFKALS